MMRDLQWMAVIGGILLAAPAYATSAPKASAFELYGNALKGTDITALWKGEVVSEVEADNDGFRLDVPIGIYMPYHPGDKIEIDVDNELLRMVTIGSAGTARRLVLYKK
jgi:hypothetical protein